MPVRKFRSVEAMSTATWRSPGDPELARLIEALWTRGRRQQGARFPPGLHRYHSIEELDAQVERWQQAYVDRRQRGGHAADGP